MYAGRLVLLLLLAGATADVALGQDAVRGERYVTTDLVATNQGPVLEVRAVVEVLGVIDVSRELAPSGKLVTFVFGEEIQTADCAAFAPVRSDAVFATMPVRAHNVGDRAELCTTLYVREAQSVPDLSDVDLKKFLKVERDGALVTDYSLSLPRDHESNYRSNTDFCIGGLAFSSNYQITIRKGLSFTANRWPRSRTRSPYTAERGIAIPGYCWTARITSCRFVNAACCR